MLLTDPGGLTHSKPNSCDRRWSFDFWHSDAQCLCCLKTNQLDSHFCSFDSVGTGAWGRGAVRDKQWCSVNKVYSEAHETCSEMHLGLQHTVSEKANLLKMGIQWCNFCNYPEQLCFIRSLMGGIWLHLVQTKWWGMVKDTVKHREILYIYVSSVQ